MSPGTAYLQPVARPTEAGAGSRPGFVCTAARISGSPISCGSELGTIGRSCGPTSSRPLAVIVIVMGLEWAYRNDDAPWDIGRPQPAIVRLAEDGRITGEVIDVGCGTGENALCPRHGVSRSSALTEHQRRSNGRRRRLTSKAQRDVPRRGRARSRRARAGTTMARSWMTAQDGAASRS